MYQNYFFPHRSTQESFANYFKKSFKMEKKKNRKKEKKITLRETKNRTSCVIPFCSSTNIEYGSFVPSWCQHNFLSNNKKQKKTVLHWSPPVESPIQEEGRGFALSHHTTREYDSPFKEI